MRSLKFAANLSFLFPTKGILEGYEVARAFGFKGVETSYPYTIPLQDIKKLKETTGMEQVIINTFPGDMPKGEFGFAAVENVNKKFLESFNLALEYAEALKCSRIHILSGKDSATTPLIPNSPEAMAKLEQNLRAIVPQLEKRGIVGLIEPLNPESVPGYALGDYDKALSVIQSINNPFIRLQLDFFHLQKIEGTVDRNVVKKLLPFTGHIQIAQSPARNEPHLPGDIDYSLVFDILEEERYKGWIGLEYSPLNKENPENDLKDWMEKFNCTL